MRVTRTDGRRGAPPATAAAVPGTATSAVPSAKAATGSRSGSGSRSGKGSGTRSGGGSDSSWGTGSGRRSGRGCGSRSGTRSGCSCGTGAGRGPACPARATTAPAGSAANMAWPAWIMPVRTGPARVTRSRRSSSSAGDLAIRLTPARCISDVFCLPCPAMGRKLMIGRPIDNASIEVSPPAFSTMASAAAMRAGMSSRHPSARPPGIRSSFRRRRSSVPQRATGTNRPQSAMARNVLATAPTPHEPATMSTALSRGPRHRSARARFRSWDPPKRGDTSGPVASTGPLPFAVASAAGMGWTARFMSTSGWTQRGWTPKSVMKFTTGTGRLRRWRSRPRTVEARG